MATTRSPCDPNDQKRKCGKSYGNTTIGDGGRAHLGDVSQDVNIHGDVHLHLQSPLGVLAMTGSVMELLHAGSSLSLLYKQIVEKNIRLDLRLDAIAEFSTVLKSLPHLSRQLNVITAKQATTEPEQILSSVAKLVRNNAHPLWDDFRELSRANLDRPPHGPWGPLTPADMEMARADRELARADMETEVEDLEPWSPLSWNQAAESWLYTTQTTLSRFWTDKQISTRLNELLALRGKLNAQLGHVINAGEATDSFQGQSNAVTEVLSVNENLKTGLQSVAAIFKLQNGRNVAISSDNLQHRAQSGRDRSLIKYDFAQYATHSGQPLVEPAPDFLNDALNTLYFREEGDRRIEIKEAHKRTFSWAFEQPKKPDPTHFLSWLENDADCFWVNGKAGSGKSTLMKYIYQHADFRPLLRRWAQKKELLIASFFFWYAGQPLQKSHEGVLRSLLHQILQRRPRLIPIVLPRLCERILTGDHDDGTGRRYPGAPLCLSELKSAFDLLLANFPDDMALCLVIDGVDEFSGDHFDFSRFLVRIASKPSIKLLVSSRPIAMCHRVFSRFPSLRLQDLTTADIKGYIEDELLSDELLIDMDRLETGFARDVTTALTEKASGVFLWIVIVVRRLLIGLGNYDDRQSLMNIIDELPADLEDLYDHMFAKMDAAYQREGSFLLQLMSYAKDIQNFPVAALQLFVASRNPTAADLTDKAVSYDQDEEQLRVKAIDGKLRSRCCGLLEVQYHGAHGPLEEPKVDFLHRTVYDFLRDFTVWRKIRNLYQLDKTEAALALLASFTHMLKRRAISPACWVSSVLTHMRDYFAAALQCSLELSDSLGNATYADYLAIADATFLNRCVNLGVYKDACDLAQSVPMLPDQLFLEQSTAHLTVSMCRIGQLGLCDYFARRIREPLSMVGDKTILLLYMLTLSISLTSSKLGLQLRNIASLLESGVDPNALAYCNWDEHASPHFQIAWQIAPNTVKRITPWNYWIVACQATAASVKITLLLLKAGADVSNTFSEQRRSEALDTFRNRIKNYQSACQDPESIKEVKEVLSRLGEEPPKRKELSERELVPTSKKRRCRR